MKNTFKKNIGRTFSIFLAVFLLLGTIPIVGVSAATNKPIISGNFEYYVLPDGTIRLNAYYGDDEYLNIPSYLDEYEVTSIGRVGALWYSNSDMKYLNTKEIFLPKTLKTFLNNDAANGFLYWRSLESIDVDENNPYFCSKDGCLYNSNYTELLYYPEGKKDNEFVIPDSVTSIVGKALNYNSSLKKIYLGKNIISIGENSFEYFDEITLYVYNNSYALDWAKEHGFAYEIMEEPPIEKDLVDEGTGIKVKGTMDPDATLKVEKVESTVEDAVATYDITLRKDGDVIQPSGTITISIPSEIKDCKLFWVKDDGTKVEVNAIYENGNYVFTTDHLSVYALVKEPEPTTTEPVETTTAEPITTVPVPTTTEPVETTTAEPVTTVPVPTTTESVETTTAEPVTTVPVPTTTEPVETTTAEPATTVPVPTTTEPVETTTAEPATTVPVPTTTEPVETTTAEPVTAVEPVTTVPVPTTDPVTTVEPTTKSVATPDTPIDNNNSNSGNNSSSGSSTTNTNTSNGAVATGNMLGFDNNILIAIIIAATTALIAASKRRNSSK